MVTVPIAFEARYLTARLPPIYKFYTEINATECDLMFVVEGWVYSVLCIVHFSSLVLYHMSPRKLLCSVH